MRWLREGQEHVYAEWPFILIFVIDNRKGCHRFNRGDREAVDCEIDEAVGVALVEKEELIRIDYQIVFVISNLDTSFF